MSLRNTVVNEFMIPRDRDVTSRLNGFFESIGWHVRPDTDEPDFVYVQPIIGSVPTVGYWHTENERKVSRFAINSSGEPSEFSNGLRLPQLEDLVEVSMVVPDDNVVHELWTRGGTLLESHAHIPLRSHAGAEEFRFSDPFNYSLRITADPGYQLEN